MFLIILISSLFCFSSSEKSDCRKAVKLYEQCQDYIHGNAVDSVCLSEQGHRFFTFYNRLQMKDDQGTRKYKHGTLWGYQRGNDIYRYYEATRSSTKGYYKIVDQEGLVIYVKSESTPYRMISGYMMPSTYKVYFYSKDLNAPLKKLNHRNLRSDYQHPLFIEEISKLPRLTKKNQQGGLQLNTLFRKYY